MQHMLVVITGGAGGIGEACAREILVRGGMVFITDMRVPNDVKDALANDFGADRTGFAEADVTDPKSLAQVMQQAATMHDGCIDALINSAGIQIQAPLCLALDAAMKDGKPVMQTAASFAKVIDINLKGAFNATEAALPYMVAAGGGAVVNMSSVHGHVGSHDRAPYCASKFGMMGMTRALAGDLARYNIRVNTISPAFVKTPLAVQGVEVLAAQQGISYEEAEKTRLANQGGEWITLAQIAAVSADLIEGSAGVGTGEDILLGGGYVEHARADAAGLAIFDDEIRKNIQRLNAAMGI
jgi:NAD(P)-dependent dehydrogenase (short-subunit alcohol dehydrogenase family)